MKLHETMSTISKELEADYNNKGTNSWDLSPYKWMKSLPSRTIGAVGEQLVSKFFESMGAIVKRSDIGSDADRKINGHYLEIKTSTLWKNGNYKFQQIRNQQYDLIVLFGISPFATDMWVVPKHVIMDQWNKQEDVVNQHKGGHSAGADTAWLTINPNRVPGWLSKYKIAATYNPILTQKP